MLYRKQNSCTSWKQFPEQLSGSHHSHRMEVSEMSKKGSMTPDAARRIQASADRSGTNQGFKSRAMSSATKNSKK